jgi:hypothetical protein
MGRNIFQSSSPVAMIQAVRAVVHGDATAAQAYELFRSLQKPAAKRAAAKKPVAKKPAAKKPRASAGK